MEFRVIDYSSLAFAGGIPAERRGKFIHLIEGGEVELLILSPYQLAGYHAQILERYCSLNGIEGSFVGRKQDAFRVTGAGIEVIGGGHWKIDETALRIDLHGESTMYGPFKRDGLSRKVRGLLEYGSYTVVVG